MISQFFKDNGGEFSMVRLCCFLCVITACLLAVFCHGKLLEISTLLGFGLGSKVAQRFKEN